MRREGHGWDMMILIPCDADCKHQSEGYCCLDQASRVTNADGGCAYYEEKRENSCAGQTGASHPPSAMPEGR